MSDLMYRGLPVLALGIDVPCVNECHGHREPGQTCAQCDGAHDHEWVAVHVHDELAIRCRICGGRCCSTLYNWQPRRNPCIGRRHHGDYHIYRDGGIEPVGVLSAPLRGAP